MHSRTQTYTQKFGIKLTATHMLDKPSTNMSSLHFSLSQWTISLQFNDSFAAQIVLSLTQETLKLVSVPPLTCSHHF